VRRALVYQGNLPIMMQVKMPNASHTLASGIREEKTYP
jgi:hypothetical protein